MPQDGIDRSTNGPIDLRVERMPDPLGIDTRQPRLSWRLPEGLAQPQSAFQIQVATTQERLKSGLPDLWDSRKVSSDRSQEVLYVGNPLASAQQAFWKVRIWTSAIEPGEWSERATWTMGLLDGDDWKPARWITAVQACLDPNDLANPDGPARDNPNPIGIDSVRFDEATLLKQHVPAQSIQLRKMVVIRAGLKRAVLFSTGLAHYEATINGKPVSDRLLSPGWTNYRKTVLYDTTDVTQALAGVGEHELRLMLGNGMYNVYYSADRYVKFVNTFGAQKAMALLRIEYEDGGVEHVGTDTSWQASDSPMTYSNVFGGENYDQRRETNTLWKPAIRVDSPGGRLRGHSASAPVVRAIEALNPVSITPHSPRSTIVDLGQNASVMPRVIASGPAGSSVSISPSELLGTDGSIDRASCVQDRGGPAYWQYTFDGRGPSTLFPKFFYQGARYFQIELTPAPDGGALPTIESVEGIVVHSTAEPVGHFECSNGLFNRIYSLVRWAQRSNMIHVMTDCPAREKLGWLEQLHLNGPSLRYNFRLDQFFHKELNDMADAQDASGFVPNIAPEHFSADAKVGHHPMRDSPEWGSSLILAGWQQYLFHGDVSLLETFYPAMVRYFDYLVSTSTEHLLTNALGDWYDIGPKAPWGSQLTPPTFTASAVYFYDALVLAKIAPLVGRDHEAERFIAQAAKTRAALNARFQNPSTRLYTQEFPYPQGSQCATAMALALNIAPDADRTNLVNALIADIRANQNGLTAGDVGYRFVLRALADAGRNDVVFEMNTNPDRPGYAMQLAKGATALTEKWDASVGSFGSQNHFMLGQINEWFFHDLAGIQPDEASPGFKHIVIRPQPCGDVNSVDATYRSGYGKIAVTWKLEPTKFLLTATIPPNTTSTVHSPFDRNAKPIQLAAGRHKIIFPH